MLADAFKQIKTAIILLMLFTFITGIIYPLIITSIAQIFYPRVANGSLIKQNDKIIGSIYIGQSFTDAKYFWGRPSATLPFPYNAANSMGSNLSPSNSKLQLVVTQRIQTLKNSDPSNTLPIPVDLVTASASGLDPEISPLAASYQVHRIALKRGVDETKIKLMLKASIKSRTFKILGEPRVNVLELNKTLDEIK